MAVVDGAGIAAGSATATGAAALFAVLAGLAAGQATVSGDMNPHGAGTASGVSTASGMAAVEHHASCALVGGSATSTSAGKLVFSTGVIHGTSLMEWDYFINGGGQADGQATTTGSGYRIVNASGRIVGDSYLGWIGAPLPIYGRSVMVGHAEVDHHLPAVRAIVSPPKSFRYLQHLQRGDLPIYLCDRAGPVSPVWVRFTMHQVLRCGARKQIGPGQRAPAQGVVGEYYATGRAGESGQPGNWVIVWEFRRNLSSATQSKEMEFQVLDAVAAADPRDITVRHRKYGWN
jgi:hypothetical protein